VYGLNKRALPTIIMDRLNFEWTGKREREEEGKICDWFLLIKDYSEGEKKNVLLLL